MNCRNGGNFNDSHEHDARHDQDDVRSHDEPQDGRRDDDAREDDETHLGYVPHGQRHAHGHGLDDDDAHGNGENVSNDENGTDASPKNDDGPNVVDDVKFHKLR